MKSAVPVSSHIDDIFKVLVQEERQLIHVWPRAFQSLNSFSSIYLSCLWTLRLQLHMFNQRRRTLRRPFLLTISWSFRPTLWCTFAFDLVRRWTHRGRLWIDKLSKHFFHMDLHVVVGTFEFGLNSDIKYLERIAKQILSQEISLLR
jgi:hypothetical protein